MENTILWYTNKIITGILSNVQMRNCTELEGLGEVWELNNIIEKGDLEEIKELFNRVYPKGL